MDRAEAVTVGVDTGASHDEVDAWAGLRPGDPVGRYRLVRELGRGGMARVFVAHDPELDREVALKLLHDHIEVGGAARLRLEARTLARVSDPHVVQILAVGEENGRTWIVMELVLW
jgi:eukaryotic-like serine/threonine-protein kinase